MVRRAGVSAVLGGLGLGAPAGAQWTAVRLHDAPFVYSHGFAGAGDWQGGTGAINNFDPIIWHSSSSKWINLAPATNEGGSVYGMHGDRQVGRINGRSTLWFGTPESRVDLHPQSAALSEALAAWDNQQVGWAGTTAERAALWHGSAASYVDLHPAGAVQSRATAVAGGQQGGTVSFGSSVHGALWSGTAASFVDLNPPGATNSSIRGMWPGQQVGVATFPSVGTLGGYWSGTAQSFVSLQPANASFVEVLATCGSAQVGRGAVPVHSALIWFGTPESMVNLHALLPGGLYFQSEASSVVFHNGLYYVTGTATGSTSEAWLWIGVRGPASSLLFLGAGSMAAFTRKRAAYYGSGHAPHVYAVRKSELELWPR